MLQVGNHEAIVTEYKSTQRQKEDVQRRQDMMRGSLATIRDGVQRAQRDLASPNYRDIDTRYRKQLIELKTTEMANSDLEKYHKVGVCALHCGSILHMSCTCWMCTSIRQYLYFLLVTGSCIATQSCVWACHVALAF